MVVSERLPSQPVHSEGSVSYLRVSGPGDAVVVDGPVTNGRQARGRRPLLDRSLPPGEYAVSSYQRPCQASCSTLEPPTDRCEGRMQVRSGEERRLTVVLEQAGGCRLVLGNPTR